MSLIFLVPLIGEVLSGSTRLSYIAAFVPEMLVWGCGVLLARELVRRWQAGWPSLLLLGLALSIAEECLIQQTSLAPLPWKEAAGDYARVFGVNWFYLLFMLVYESVIVVLVPIQVTEFVFRERSSSPWLTKWRIVRATWLFTVGSFMAFYGWVKRARPMMLHVPFYIPPARTLLASTALIVSLVLLAYLARNTGKMTNVAQPATSPWVIGIAVLALGFPWYLVIGAVFSPSFRPQFSFWWEIAAGVVWAGLTCLLFRRWSTAGDWGTIHRWAACFGAMLVCIVAGFLGSSAWLRMDIAFKIVVDLLMIVWMLSLLRKLQSHNRSSI